jgi:A nuclease family of the HNH/ENDO VII superfamily with conserved AHH
VPTARGTNLRVRSRKFGSCHRFSAQTATAATAANVARTRTFRNALASEGKLTSAAENAHHIVEIGDNSRAAIRSREILVKYGVDINDTANGIGLLNHAGRHSDAYSGAVLNRINRAGSATELRSILGKIGSELRAADRAVSKRRSSGGESSRATREWTRRQEDRNRR